MHQVLIDLIPKARGWYREEYPLAGTPEQPVGERVAQALELVYKPRHLANAVGTEDDADYGEGIFLRWSQQALEGNNYKAAASHAGRLIGVTNQYWARQGNQVLEQILDIASKDTGYFLDRVYFPGYHMSPYNSSRIVRNTDP
jgi:hypothetical protein